ncbi:MAG: hypothetical protein ACI4XL_12885 [Bacillus sp. (in: firmicutes)]
MPKLVSKHFGIMTITTGDNEQLDLSHTCIGKPGIMVVYESVNEYPGKYFVKFYYDLEINGDTNKSTFKANCCLATGCGTMHMTENGLTITDTAIEHYDFIFKFCNLQTVLDYYQTDAKRMKRKKFMK